MNFLFSRFSNQSAKQHEEVDKPRVYFLKDLPQYRREIPIDLFDDTWIITKKHSREQGLLSVLNKTLFIAIGKSSQCEPFKGMIDVQIEVDKVGETLYCIDVMRFNKNNLCYKDLEARLNSIDDETYKLLNIEKRRIIRYSQEELIRIRDNDNIESEYILQKLSDPYLGQRYVMTYAELVAIIIKRPIEEKKQENKFEKVEEKIVVVPRDDKPYLASDDEVLDEYEEMSSEEEREFNYRRQLVYQIDRKIDFQKDKDTQFVLDLEDTKNLKNRKKSRYKLHKDINYYDSESLRGRDVNRFYDVANRPKD
jgi:hypothetical protein